MEGLARETIHYVISRRFTALSYNSCFLPLVGRSLSAKKAFNLATVAETAIVHH